MYKWKPESRNGDKDRRSSWSSFAFITIAANGPSCVFNDVVMDWPLPNIIWCGLSV